MRTAELLEALSRPEAWPARPDTVEIVQTHVSAVFLVGDEAYKVKKEIDLGFLDFSSLERRRRCCEAEVRLNRRLAPDVYRGVVPVVREGAGLRVGGTGEPVEWAVRMRRLPEDRTFRSLLRAGRLDASHLERLALRLAAFFADAGRGPEVDADARFVAVARNCRENYEHAERFVGETLSAAVLERSRELTERALRSVRDLIESRVDRGFARDGHGDLRLDHAYDLPDQPEPLVVVDCIEFSDRLRHGDPVFDVAFLVMELEFAERPDLGETFARAFLTATADSGGDRLLPLAVAYRHAVRGKVRSIESREPEIPASARAAAGQTARAHFMRALGRLAPPGERPALVLVGGLPGTGKSTLARQLEETAGFHRISSDETRKRLAGLRPTDRAAAQMDGGLYAPAWTERTYAECGRLARQALFEGRRVVVDASFREDHRRLALLDLGRSWGVPVAWLDCAVDEGEAARRLARRRGDASDADARIRAAVSRRWDPPSKATAAKRHAVSTAGVPEQTLRRALAALASDGLA